MNCSGASLESFPSSVPDNTDVLDLRNNTIADLCTVYAYMENLTVLNLQSNRIGRVCTDFLVEMTSHKGLHIDIRDNKLTKLPKEIRSLKTVQWRLSGNPFHCSCESLWMRDWFNGTLETTNNETSIHEVIKENERHIDQQETGCDSEKDKGPQNILFPNNIVVDYPHVVCHAGQFAGQSIYTLRAGKMGCLPLAIQTIIILASIVAIGLMVFSLILYAYKRWNEIRWNIYKKFNRFIARGEKHEDLDNIVFDALMAYRWVFI